MTLQVSANRVNFDGDDVTSVFPFTFKTADAAWIEVLIGGVPGGVPTNNVVLNVDQESSPGGTVTFTGAVPQTGEVLTIQRIATLDQLVDYAPFDAFPAETHEGALDKGIVIAQQQQDALDRALVASPATPIGADLQLPAPEAGKGLIWNPAGDALVNSDETINDIANTAEGHADDSAASAGASAGSAAASSASASAAAASAVDADDTLKEFETIYLGEKAADPTLDNEGGALIVGAEYFNTVENEKRTYDGVIWVIPVGGGPSLGEDSIIRTNAETIGEDITIPLGTNGSSVGPIEILDTFTVTVLGVWAII